LEALEARVDEDYTWLAAPLAGSSGGRSKLVKKTGLKRLSEKFERKKGNSVECGHAWHEIGKSPQKIKQNEISA
jgi:hypothetical protein